jgi:hypothetical protein
MDDLRIDGWTVQHHDTAPAWSATRRGGLSNAQLEFGCALRVTATTFGELEVRCVAENVKHGIVAAAERLAERMVEAELQRRADGRTLRTNGPGSGINA